MTLYNIPFLFPPTSFHTLKLLWIISPYFKTLFKHSMNERKHKFKENKIYLFLLLLKERRNLRIVYFQLMEVKTHLTISLPLYGTEPSCAWLFLFCTRFSIIFNIGTSMASATLVIQNTWMCPARGRLLWYMWYLDCWWWWSWCRCWNVYV